MAHTAGALTIVGNYVQTAAGIFQLDIGGLIAGSGFDLVTVTQLATLSGTLDISVLTGFTPTNGEIFKFLITGSHSGTFGTVNGLNYGGGTFAVDYSQPGYVELAFSSNQQPIPEPGTFLLLGSGLLSLSYGMRRRFKK